MKKILGLFAVISVLFILQSCNQENAQEYNNKIISQQLSIVQKIDNLKKSIDDYNVLPANDAIKNMSEAYDAAIFQIDSGMVFLETVEPYKKDNSLLEASKTLFKSYKSLIENDFKQIIELYKLPDQMFTPADQKKLDELQNDSKKKLQDAFDSFIEVQKEFAAKNDLNLG